MHQQIYPKAFKCKTWFEDGLTASEKQLYKVDNSLLLSLMFKNRFLHRIKSSSIALSPFNSHLVQWHQTHFPPPLPTELLSNIEEALFLFLSIFSSNFIFFCSEVVIVIKKVLTVLVNT